MFRSLVKTTKSGAALAYQTAQAVSGYIPDNVKTTLSSSAQALGQLAENHLPQHITGAVKHSLHWLDSKDEDHTFTNPNFVSVTGLKDDSGVTLYLIHGTGDRTGGFVKFAKDILSKNNFPASVKTIRVPHFSNRFEGEKIEHFAAELATKIKEYKDKNIVMLGHSRGGLVASLCATNFLNHITTNILAIFSIGTPYAGTLLASIPGLSLFSSSVGEMQEDTEFLKQLNEMIKEKGIPHYGYSCEHDWVVLKSHSCAPSAYKHNLTRFPKVGHLSAANSERVELHFNLRLGNTLAELAPHLVDPTIELSKTSITVNPDGKASVNIFVTPIVKGP